MLYFSVYEGIKRALSKDGTKLSPLAVMCGGGLAGVCRVDACQGYCYLPSCMHAHSFVCCLSPTSGMANWSVSIPIDTVKSRIQTFPAGTYTGMADCARYTQHNTTQHNTQSLIPFPSNLTHSPLGLAPLAFSRKLIAEEGAATLFRGFGPVMLRAFPANAACFMGREVALKFMDWMGDSEGVLPGEVVVA